MFKIAVCDDEKVIVEELHHMLKEIQKQLFAELEIEEFFSGETLKASMEKGSRYDFIFLDIQLKELDGIELGHIIREQFEDIRVQIIYISSRTDYAMELFEVQPLGFLVKPLQRSKVEKLVRLGIERSNKNRKIFSYRCGIDIYRIELRDIVYFEAYNKEVRIVDIKGNSNQFASSLKKIEEELKEYDFFRPHNSFLINPNLIKAWEKDGIRMEGDILIPIASNRRTEVREIRNYLGTKEW